MSAAIYPALQHLEGTMGLTELIEYQGRTGKVLMARILVDRHYRAQIGSQRRP